MLVGGAISAVELGVLETALAATDDDSRSGFLSADQLSMVERIADVIVPETDTPGAVAAGAHRFIDRMLADWASPDTQQEFAAGLAAIDSQAAERGANFLDSSSERQVAIVTELDGEAFAPGATDSFFRRLKKLVLFAYFSSEPGATEALRFDRTPGDYDPCLSLEGDGRAWFWLGYSYDL